MPTLKNTRHEAFAQARLVGMTIDAAYVEAGYKANRSNAARMNANENVRSRIQELQEAASKRAEITGAQTLREIGCVAFSDIRALFDQSGRLLPVHSLPEPVARSIQSVKIAHKTVPGSDPVEVEYISEIKFWDKNNALEKLAKHFKLYEDEKKGGDPVANLLGAIMRAAKPLPVAEGDV